MIELRVSFRESERILFLHREESEWHANILPPEVSCNHLPSKSGTCLPRIDVKNFTLSMDPPKDASVIATLMDSGVELKDGQFSLKLGKLSAVTEDMDVMVQTSDSSVSKNLEMRSGQELRNPEKLFPDDRQAETNTLGERGGDLLNSTSPERENEAWLTAKEQAELFKEMRADYAAGKRADAHGCAKESYERILDARAQAPAPVAEKDKNIER